MFMCTTLMYGDVVCYDSVARNDRLLWLCGFFVEIPLGIFQPFCLSNGSPISLLLV